jgi:hypothetical protein
MKADYEKLRKEILEIIELCEFALNGKLTELASGSSETQISNIIIPEMRMLLNAIDIGTIKSFKGKRLNSAWYVIDTWDNKSVLGEKILALRI